MVEFGPDYPRTMDAEITLRPAYEDDTSFARAVHHAAVRDVVVRQFGAWDEAAQDVFFVDDWDPSKFEIVIFSGVPCGYVRIEQLPSHVEVAELNILPKYQRKGIGTRVLRDVISRAEMLRLPVRLQTLRMNDAAKLYRSLGFREIGRTQTHIKMCRDADCD